MKAHRLLVPAALVAAVALTAPPAFAQRHGRGGGEQAQSRGGGGEQRRSGGGDRGSAPQRQPEAQRGGTVDRSQPAQNAAPSRPANGGGAYAVRRPNVAPPSYGNRGYSEHGYSNRGYYPSRGYYSGGHYYGPRGYYYGRPRIVVPVVPYYRPYYAFRPHFSLGFGIYIGYPVPYPYSYGYPAYVYGYPYPSAPYPPAGYPPDPYGYGNAYPQSAPGYPQSAPGYPQQDPYGSVTAQPPAQGSYGGVSFEITPDDAAVFVDGAYVGVARDFGPDHQPLTMTPGTHRIELQARGCQPMSFEVNVAAGQVIPYRGALQPQ